ncbi:tetratricopeptide repeat protein [Desulfospira joergensenii]|uniref:tetratricopeptide repeat protein n=1 Tax=Desulfospira joergensenii TaxID=53329 RepID=UPI0003B33BBB|nr:tetratricopeptide repeat protein [Desulfospira joergensenii]
MKNFLFLILAGFFLISCAGSAHRPNQTNIGQAIKTEGEIFLRQGNYTVALTKLLEAEKSIPDDPYLHNSLGLAYMGKKRNDLAAASFKKALNLKPDYMDAVNNLGAAYLRQNKWDLAIETFKSLLGNLLYPTPHFPLSNIGWAYLEKKEFSRAETYFKKSLDLFPGFVTASHGLAQVYLQTGQTDRALDYLHTCLNRSPKTAIFLADLAQAYEKKGDRTKALRSWKKVRHLSPKNSGLARKADEKISELK